MFDKLSQIRVEILVIEGTGVAGALILVLQQLLFVLADHGEDLIKCTTELSCFKEAGVSTAKQFQELRIESFPLVTRLLGDDREGLARHTFINYGLRLDEAVGAANLASTLASPCRVNLRCLAAQGVLNEVDRIDELLRVVLVEHDEESVVDALHSQLRHDILELPDRELGSSLGVDWILSESSLEVRILHHLLHDINLEVIYRFSVRVDEPGDIVCND